MITDFTLLIALYMMGVVLFVTAWFSRVDSHCRGDEQLERWKETAGRREHVVHAENSGLGRGNDDMFAAGVITVWSIIVNSPPTVMW